MQEIEAAEMDRVGDFVVKLASCGNIDHGQNPFQEMPGVGGDSVQVKTIREASKACRQFIDENDLGGGNWTGGDVFEGAKLIARISYNGRAWAV